MIIPIGKYYVYRWIRLDKNEPFYVGLGTKDFKAYTHNNIYKEALRSLDRPNKIFKAIFNKCKTKVEILLESDDYEFIKQKEIEFIKLYGRKNLNTGTLSNLTNGGEGTKGLVFTAIHRERISINRKGILHTEETKQKLRIAREKQVLSEDHWIKAAIAHYKEVDCFDSNGVFIKRYSSIDEASLKTNISRSGIGSTMNGIRNKAGGMIWRKVTSKELPSNLENTNIMTWNKVEEIRRLFKNGSTKKEIAKLLNFKEAHIKSIIYNKSWIKN